MSVNYSIITGKGTTREYVVNSNSVYPVSSYTGVPVTLSVSLSSLPLSANKDFIVFAINDKFVLTENNSIYNLNRRQPPNTKNTGRQLNRCLS